MGLDHLAAMGEKVIIYNFLRWRFSLGVGVNAYFQICSPNEYCMGYAGPGGICQVKMKSRESKDVTGDICKHLKRLDDKVKHQLRSNL
jgi:hypothetical protein